jgi:predicted phosphodiesterase
MHTLETQIQEVVRLRDDEDKTFVEIADQLEISERTVRRRYAAAQLHRAADELTDGATLEKFPEVEPLVIKAKDFLEEDVEVISRFTPVQVVGDAVIACDLHIPLYDPGLVNVLIRAAKKEGIKTLIIAGDFWNMDEFSSYPPVQPEAKFDIERKEGNIVLKTLLRWFDSIIIIWGNHDFRLTRSLGYKYSFTECMKWAFSSLTDEEMAKVTFSDLDYMYYHPGGAKDWKIRVCHPSTYSDQPLVVPRKLAIKYNCGVYTAHSHHCAIGAAPNGHDIILEGGGFFDKSRTEYIQRTNPNHEWVSGFFFFKDGFPHMISPLIGTDLAYRKEVNK